MRDLKPLVVGLFALLACTPATRLDAGAPDAVVPDAGAHDLPPDGGRDAGVATLHVLFIGNSYTYVNDLPGMVQQIAATAGVPPLIETDMIAVGGATLIQHWDGPDAQPRINERRWSHVVLQGQSLEPLDDTWSFEYGATSFAALIVDAGAQPTWYVTWARAASDAGYPYPGGPEEMQDRLTEEYDHVAAPWPQSVLSCVGEAFGAALPTHPEITLHQSDLSHPTVAGTYLAACTFYTALTGNPVPATSAVPAGLSSTEAATLRDVAKVGSDCAGKKLKATLEMRSCPTCPTGGTAVFRYGTAGIRLSNVFYLFNKGESATGLSDGLTLAPPYEWSQDAGFPGGSGPLTVSGVAYEWCGAQLAPDAGCALSVDFTGAADGQGRMSVAPSNTYPNQSTVDALLFGSTTSRALITVSEEPGYFGCTDDTCGRPAWIFADAGTPVQLSLVVTNRGAQSATLGEGDPLAAPYFWGTPDWDGGFPGGTGGASIGAMSYPFCAPTLAPGQQCAVTVGVVPIAGTPLPAAVNVAYSDADGTVTPNANRRLMTLGQ
jgi:hypothetical protein